jgi:hypothetical protein
MARRSTLLGAVAGAAAAAVAAGQCATPFNGQNITLQPPGTGVGTWTFTSSNPLTGIGALSPMGSPTLCIGIGPIYGPSGAPQLVLAPCSSTDPSQRWTPSLLPGPTVVYNGLAGQVIDIFNNEHAPGTIAEVFSPNGGANQLFTWTAKAGGPGALVSSLDNTSVLAVC